MASVIEMFRRSCKKKNKNAEGDVLGLIRMMYPDIEYDPTTTEMLLKKYPTGKSK